MLSGVLVVAALLWAMMVYVAAAMGSETGYTTWQDWAPLTISVVLLIAAIAVW